jgi:hypothetical protein
MNTTQPINPFATKDAGLIGAPSSNVAELESGRLFSADLEHALTPSAPSPGEQSSPTSPGGRGGKAYEAAQDLVSITFVLPMFAQAREEPFKSDLFHGGQGEKLFGARLDEIMADRVTRSMRLPMVDAVYRKIMRMPAASAQPVDTHG